MSAFKRHQSKVFWNHMATQDLESVDPFVARNDFTRTKQNHGRIHDIPEEEAEERSSSINESDTFETANVTAIRVCPNGNENSQDLYHATTIHEGNDLMTQT